MANEAIRSVGKLERPFRSDFLSLSLPRSTVVVRTSTFTLCRTSDRTKGYRVRSTTTCGIGPSARVPLSSDGKSKKVRHAACTRFARVPRLYVVHTYDTAHEQRRVGLGQVGWAAAAVHADVCVTRTTNTTLVGRPRKLPVWCPFRRERTYNNAVTHFDPIC